MSGVSCEWSPHCHLHAHWSSPSLTASSPSHPHCTQTSEPWCTHRSGGGGGRGEGVCVMWELGATCCVNRGACDSSLGKPSMRNPTASGWVKMACFNSPTVTSWKKTPFDDEPYHTSVHTLTAGTSLPCFIISSSCFPWEVPLATSSLRRSPADRCVNPKSCTIRSHWVPLPLPGPPA